MNTSYKGIIVSDDKRTIEWVPIGTIKLRPRDFTSKDAKFLLASQGLFARKFNETVDEGILSILESRINRRHFNLSRRADQQASKKVFLFHEDIGRNGVQPSFNFEHSSRWPGITHMVKADVKS